MPIEARSAQRTPLHPRSAAPCSMPAWRPELLFLRGLGGLPLLLFEVGLHLATLALSLVYALVFHPVAAFLCSRDPLIAPASYVRSLRYAVGPTTPRRPASPPRVRGADPALPGAP